MQEQTGTRRALIGEAIRRDRLSFELTAKRDKPGGERPIRAAKRKEVSINQIFCLRQARIEGSRHLPYAGKSVSSGEAPPLMQRPMPFFCRRQEWLHLIETGDADLEVTSRNF